MFGKVDPGALMASLKIMCQGMLGIFAVMLFITLLVYLFTKFTKK